MTDKFINFSSYDNAEDIKRLRFITNAIQTKGNAVHGFNILDIGCGNGNIGYQLAHYGHSITSIDIDAETIKQASLLHSHPSITYKVLPVEDLKNGPIFDVIICSEVIEHLYKPSIILDSIHNLLANDGIAIITVPNGQGPRELFITRPMQYILQKNNLLSHAVRKIKYMMGFKGITIQSSSQNLTHIQFFKYKELFSIAKDHQFKIDQFAVTNFLEKVFPFSIVARHFFWLQNIDCKIADLLPIKWCSGFMIIMSKRK